MGFMTTDLGKRVQVRAHSRQWPTVKNVTGLSKVLPVEKATYRDAVLPKIIMTEYIVPVEMKSGKKQDYAFVNRGQADELRREVIKRGKAGKIKKISEIDRLYQDMPIL
jgi:hypothetical protein